ncbi:MAG: dUTP diphosphatase [Pseudomonadota bacterium]
MSLTTAAQLEVPIQRLASAGDQPLPRYATAGSAGMDLQAALAEPLELAPGARAAVPCGFALALPAGWEAQVRPRSGLALKHGVTVLNAPGTIDSDYRGEIAVLLINLGDAVFRVEPGDRIAQLVVAETTAVSWQETGGLSDTRRGAGGFGSTDQPLED